MNNELAVASLDELPDKCRKATNRSQFVTHMRPYLWVKYPSATSAEINTLINAKWNMLKTSRMSSAGVCMDYS